MFKALLSLLFAFVLAVNPQEIIEKAGEHFDNGQFRETADMLSGALPDLRAAENEEDLAEALSMLAVSYSRIGAYSLAMDAQRECYEIDLKGGDAGNISLSLNNMAGFCLAMEQYDEAERLIREAISYEKKVDGSPALAVRYGMACDILLKQGKVDEAIDFATKALEIDTRDGREMQAAIRKSQLAGALMDTGDLRKASALLKEAADVFSATNNLHSLSVCRQQQGAIAAKQGRFMDAANLLREGLTLSRQTGNLLLQRNISQDLAVMLKDMDPRSAVTYMQDVVALSDSLYQQETARKMTELSLQNEMDRKEDALKDQERTIRSQRLKMWFLLGVIALLAVLAVLMFRNISIRKKNADLLQKTADIKDKLLILQASEQNGENVDALLKELSEIGSNVPDKTLTTREREIALLCCEGLLSKEIADRLNISQRTVETHKNNIFRKLEINSTAELVELMKRTPPPNDRITN